MLHKAAEAGGRNNTKGMYDVVRRLAPKPLASVSKLETFMVRFHAAAGAGGTTFLLS